MEYVVEMLNITKKFSGIKANDNITLQVKKGEIHALLGENTAGKSTLMSVLFGIYQAEKGSIRIRGRDVRIKNPKDAVEMGIGMVHQHFQLIKDFTVLENIILGEETSTLGFLRMDDARDKVEQLSKKYNMRINPDAKISEISVGMQQRVEILKMLYRNNNILIFNEPTAVLTPQEINELLKMMKVLANEGKSIIFTTNKPNEIKAVADNCTVLRHGKHIGTVNVNETSIEEMSEMMVGRKTNFKVEKPSFKPGETILSVRNLSKNSKHGGKKVLNNISFEVRKGEILSIAGIDGNGQSELVEALTGLNLADEGQIILRGQDISKKSIRYRNINGLSYIPEDRHRHGLILDYSVEENLILKRYFTKKFSPYGFVRTSVTRNFANKLISDFDIRSGEGAKTKIRSMSNDNQQKAIIAREIETDHDVLIAVQPTRGLGVGDIEYIHKQLVAECEEGKAILLVSFEIDEVMDISDRILVMYDGTITADLDPKTTTVNDLGLYMSGSKRSVAE